MVPALALALTIAAESTTATAVRVTGEPSEQWANWNTDGDLLGSGGNVNGGVTLLNNWVFSASRRRTSSS